MQLLKERAIQFKMEIEFGMEQCDIEANRNKLHSVLPDVQLQMQTNPMNILVRHETILNNSMEFSYTNHQENFDFI